MRAVLYYHEYTCTYTCTYTYTYSHTRMHFWFDVVKWFGPLPYVYLTFLGPGMWWDSDDEEEDDEEEDEEGEE